MESSAGSQQTNFFISKLIGPEIFVKFDNYSLRLDDNKMQLSIDAYVDLSNVVLGKIGKRQVWTREDVVNKAWAEISSVLWSNLAFTYKPTYVMLQGFNELSSKKGENCEAHLDCDTSAFFVADMLTSLGLECWAVSIIGHSFLKVMASDGPVWLETTVKKENLEVSYYMTEREMKKNTPTTQRNHLARTWDASITFAQ